MIFPGLVLIWFKHLPDFCIKNNTVVKKIHVYLQVSCLADDKPVLLTLPVFVSSAASLFSATLFSKQPQDVVQRNFSIAFRTQDKCVC